MESGKLPVIEARERRLCDSNMGKNGRTFGRFVTFKGQVSTIRMLLESLLASEAGIPAMTEDRRRIHVFHFH